jgi:hypothetical protein
MTQVLAIMIVIFVLLAIVLMINVMGLMLQITKTKELNNRENPFEKHYQFIKGLY